MDHSSLGLIASIIAAAGLACGGCATSPTPMIPAERIAREPVPSGFDEVDVPMTEVRAECVAIAQRIKRARAVQLAGIGLTTLGIIGALITDDDTADTVGQTAAAVGSLVQLASGTSAQIDTRRAYELNCF